MRQLAWQGMNMLDQLADFPSPFREHSARGKVVAEGISPKNTEYPELQVPVALVEAFVAGKSTSSEI